MLSTSTTFRLLDLAQVLAADGGTWRLGLFTNSPTLSPTTVTADFTEPTFTGYARSALASWNTPFINGSNQAEANGAAVVTFQPTATTGLPQTINGFFVVDGSGNYLFADYLATPFTFVDPSYAYNLLQDLIVGALA